MKCFRHEVWALWLVQPSQRLDPAVQIANEAHANDEKQHLPIDCNELCESTFRLHRKNFLLRFIAVLQLQTCSQFYGLAVLF